MPVPAILSAISQQDPRQRHMLLTSVADPGHFGVDPDADPDPSVFIIYLQDANKKLI
jgi:hypothetical protein